MSLSSFYIQRVKAHTVNEVLPSLAGYYKHGNPLSDPQKHNLGGIIPLDYMGAAEYEFGAVYKALRCIAQTQDEFTADSLVIKGSAANPGNRPFQAPVQDIQVWFFGPKADNQALRAMLSDLAKNPYPRAKERPLVQDGLFGTVRENYRKDGRTIRAKDPYRVEASRIVAWLSLAELGDEEKPWLACRNFEQFKLILTLLGVNTSGITA